MFWMAASMALSALQGMSEADAARDREKLQNAGALNQTANTQNQNLKVVNNQLSQVTASNDAIIEANTKNTAATNFKAGLLNMQLGIQKKNAAANRITIGEQGSLALGQVNANAAAAGTVGSSVKAVAQDVERTMGNALVRSAEDWDIQAQNFQTSMHDLYANMENSIGSATVGHLPDPIAPVTMLQDNVPSDGSIMLGAIMQGAQSYASASMKLGLGAQSAPIVDRSYS